MVFSVFVYQSSNHLEPFKPIELLKPRSNLSNFSNPFQTSRTFQTPFKPLELLKPLSNLSNFSNPFQTPRTFQTHFKPLELLKPISNPFEPTLKPFFISTMECGRRGRMGFCGDVLSQGGIPLLFPW